MLKFINGDGTECIPADTTAEAWHTLCGQRTVQLIAGKNIQFEDTDTDALMIATSFTDTPEHRYQQYIHSKQLAMAYGNERAGVTDVDYQFTAGYEGAIYAPKGDSDGVCRRRRQPIGIIQRMRRNRCNCQSRSAKHRILQRRQQLRSM